MGGTRIGRGTSRVCRARTGGPGGSAALLVTVGLLVAGCAAPTAEPDARTSGSDLPTTMATADAPGATVPGDPPSSTRGSVPADGGAPVADVGSAPATVATVAAGERRPLAPDAFAATDAALRRRVSSAGLGGGVAYVVRDGEAIHDVSVGGVSRATPLSVASSAKWLTAATLMTFVDEGRLGLDDPVSRWLPELAAWDPPITVRMLLDHTSGIRDQQCIWNSGGSMTDCVARLAAGPREFRPGTAFSYGNASFHVVGRLLEVLGGDDFASVVEQRLTGPLGMTTTTWPGAGANPSPAAGLRTTVDDYSRFLALLVAGGVTPDGRRLLSGSSVVELVRNQVGAYDTSRDYSVGITRIPRYALGAWPDVVDATGATEVVSGNGGKGFYPWVDLRHRVYGVIGVQDDRGAEVAVPASQAVFREARAAYAGT